MLTEKVYLENGSRFGPTLCFKLDGKITRVFALALNIVIFDLNCDFLSGAIIVGRE